jgi:hypothetical protein
MLREEGDGMVSESLVQRVELAGRRRVGSKLEHAIPLRVSHRL